MHFMWHEAIALPEVMTQGLCRSEKLWFESWVDMNLLVLLNLQLLPESQGVHPSASFMILKLDPPESREVLYSFSKKQCWGSFQRHRWSDLSSVSLQGTAADSASSGGTPRWKPVVVLCKIQKGLATTCSWMRQAARCSRAAWCYVGELRMPDGAEEAAEWPWYLHA